MESETLSNKTLYCSSLSINVTNSTIPIKEETKKTSQSKKLQPRGTYEEVIKRLIDDLSELNEETKAEIEDAKKEIASGKFVTHEQMKKNLGL